MKETIYNFSRGHHDGRECKKRLCKASGKVHSLHDLVCINHYHIQKREPYAQAHRLATEGVFRRDVGPVKFFV